jgi:hypothetical protein
MKPLLTLLIGCIALNAAAQPCKYVKPQKDEFTGKTYNMAKLAIGAPLAMRELIIYETEGKYNVGLRITFNTDFAEVSFKKGDKVHLKLASGEIIDIVAAKDLAPIVFRVLDVPLRMWYVNQDVSKTVFEKLSQSPITAVRFKLNDADHDLPGIKERQAQKIMETVQCMLNKQ